MLSKKKENDRFLEKLSKQYKLKIEEANFANGFIPKYILLDRTRNIHSYLVPVSEEVFNTLHKTAKETSKYLFFFKEYYKIQFSQLDRPLFLVMNTGKSIDFLDISTFEKYLLNEESFNDFLKNRINIENLFPILKSEL